jgi:hypothetical protein
MASFESPKLSPETVQGSPGALIHLNGLHLESGRRLRIQDQALFFEATA